MSDRPPPPRSRLLTPEGRSAVVRLQSRRAQANDLYYWLLTTPRSAFAGVLLTAYVVLNALFAGAYLASGGIENARPGSFEDAFFFSVQTLATIGYGRMSPVTTLANILVTVEAGIALFGVAVAAGLIFARFTRPTSGVMVSKVIVVNNVNGQPTLLFRLANERNNQIYEARVHMAMVQNEKTSEGYEYRRFRDLTLVRAATPVFELSWTVMHTIDEASPLFGRGAEELIEAQVEFMVLFSGHHESFQQEVHVRHAYAAEDMMWTQRFADLFRTLPDGRRAIDYSRFDLLEPLRPGEQVTPPPPSTAS